MDLFLEGDICVFRQSFRHIKVSDDIRHSLFQNLADMLAAGEWFGFTWADPEPVGCILLSKAHQWGMGLGYVENIYVVPDARGRGIAAQLLAHAEDHLRRAGCGLIQLDALRGEGSAEGLYEKLGYHISSVKMEKKI